MHIHVREVFLERTGSLFLRDSPASRLVPLERFFRHETENWDDDGNWSDEYGIVLHVEGR